MKSTLLMGSLAFLSLALFSCSNNGAKTGSDSTAATGKTAADSVVQDNRHGGQPVPGSSIQPCLDAYAQVMAQYGITSDSPSVPIKKCPPMTYRITTTEGLTYITFRHWLDSIVNTMDSAGHGSNIWLKIQPGICTQQFVTSVGADAARTGRISYFIVPALIDSSKVQSMPGGGGGGAGYEIGGLQP